jgi:peptidoglycan/xylan/chitin deacetylase (PgdA/CDA1 family)
VARPAATISVDVDPVDLHLLGYGFSGLAPDPLVYRVAVPRLIERFANAGVRGTFFVVGRDAASQRDALRALTAAGHEVASHSHSHPLSLASLPDEALRNELVTSRAALSEASASDVVGFRAPNFDMNRRTLRALVASGFRYDASAYPTPLLLPMRMVLALKSADPAKVLRLTLWPFTLNRAPHTLEGLREFPLSVTPSARLPVYHTARYFMEEARFHAQIEGFATRGESLSYVLHAVDVLGLAEDQVDVRLSAHPGMRRPLGEKIAMLDRALETIARRFDAQTFAARLGEV